jgi:hypothetical protein
MLAFRSEAHADSWLEMRSLERGGSCSLDTLWLLANEWYGGRLQPDWRRKTPEEAEAVFASVGLEGDFWRLR